jgi:hypothetical protein
MLTITFVTQGHLAEGNGWTDRGIQEGVLKFITDLFIFCGCQAAGITKSFVPSCKAWYITELQKGVSPIAE